MKKLEDEMAKLIPKEKRRLKITREMQKVVLMESETIVRKIKGEDEKGRYRKIERFGTIGSKEGENVQHETFTTRNTRLANIIMLLF